MITGITPQTLEILKIIKPISGHHEFVFPREPNRAGHISVFTANAALKRSLNFKDQLVAHGLRSIASTALHEQGFDSLQIEACFSHLDQNETRASYLRTYFLNKGRSLMRWWSD